MYELNSELLCDVTTLLEQLGYKNYVDFSDYEHDNYTCSYCGNKLYGNQNVKEEVHQENCVVLKARRVRSELLMMRKLTDLRNNLNDVKLTPVSLGVLSDKDVKNVLDDINSAFLAFINNDFVSYQNLTGTRM